MTDKKNEWISYSSTVLPSRAFAINLPPSGERPVLLQLKTLREGLM